MESTIPTRQRIDTRLLASCARISALLMLAVAASLFIRQQQLAGATHISAAGQLTITLLLASAAAAIRLLILAATPQGQRSSLLTWSLPALSCLLVSLASPGSVAGIGAGMAWALLLASELGWYACWGISAGLVTTGTIVSAVTEPGQPLLYSPQEAEPDELIMEDDEQELDQILPAETSLQLTRCSSAEGHETVEALMRISFDSGQRSQFAHLQLYPAMATSPSVICHQLAGPGCTIKVAEAIKIGGRLEIRLSSVPQQPEQVIVHLEATEASQAAVRQHAA